MKNQLQQRECNRWKVSALKEKKSANEKLKSFKDISSKECREKETLGTKGHIFQRTNTKWWLLRLILVIINLPSKNQEFFSHSNREASRECLTGLRLVYNNIHSQNTFEQCYKGKKAWSNNVIPNQDVI